MRLKLILIVLMIMGCSFMTPDKDSTIVRPDYELITQVVDLAKIELGIPDSIKIELRPLRKSLRLQAIAHGAVLKAHVDKIDTSTYLISVDELRDWELIEVVSHEMIHIKQYVSGDLERDGQRITYKGKRYGDVVTIPYNKRKWEIDAHYEGKVLGYNIKLAIRELKID